MRHTPGPVSFVSFSTLWHRSAWKIVPLIVVGSFSVSALAGVSVTPSGAATYSIGITVPPGVAGVEPKLSLEYSSQSGQGLLGYGWSLGGASAISRCPKTKLQDADGSGSAFDRPVLESNGLSSATVADDTANTTDAFCLDGQRLIKKDGYPGLANGEYRLEHEGYSRIRYENNLDKWTVETKSGNLMTYGGAGSTAVPSGANNRSRAWLLNTVSDTKNNTMTFSYRQGNSTADWRIDSIGYGASNGSNAVFFYYEPRNDVQAGWLNGIQNVNNQRLRMIQVVSTTVEVRRYLLSYPSNATSLTNRDLITQIQECVPVAGMGATVKGNTSTNNTTSQKCLSSLKFTYNTNGNLNVSTTNGPAFTNTNGYAVDATEYNSFQWIDINSDGHPDVCAHDPWGLGCYITHVASDGTLSYGTTAGYYYSLPGFYSDFDWHFMQWADINSDGLPDACGRFTGGMVCYINTTTSPYNVSFNTSSPIVDTYWSNTNGWNSPEISNVIIDINGDGFPDICGRNSSGFMCHLNTAGTGFSSTATYSNTDLDNAHFRGSFSTGAIQTYSTIHYTDIDQDGYIDICAYYPSATANGMQYDQYCWLNNRKGGFKTKFATNVKVGQNFSAGLDNPVDINANPGPDTYRALNINPDAFIDLNQDGRPDYCLRTISGMSCWINQQYSDGTANMVATSISGLSGLFPTGSGWSAEAYGGTIQFTDINSDSRADLCARDAAGNGMRCFLNTPASSSPYLTFQETTGGFFGKFPNSSYSDPSLYKSIRFFALANGRTALFGRGWGEAASTIYTMGNLQGEANDLLSTITAGGTPPVSITYGNGAITSGLYTKGSPSGIPPKNDFKAFDLPAPMPLVSKISMTPSDGAPASFTSYQYSGLMAQMKRGMLGFGQVISTMSPSNNWVQTTYRQDWPFIGMPHSVTAGNNTTIAAKTFNRYLAVDLANGANTVANSGSPTVTNGCGAIAPTTANTQAVQGRYLIYPYEVEQDNYSPDTPNKQLSQVISNTITESNQGNVTCVSVKTRDTLDTLNPKVREKVTTNTYDTNAAWTYAASSQYVSSNDRWILGRLTSSSVVSKAPASAFSATPVLGSSQGGYSQLPFKPNDIMGSEAPVYPNVAGWLIPTFR